MKTFEDYQEEMNPYYKSYEAFIGDGTAICYIPENAESLEDAFTYLDLWETCEEWANDNAGYMSKNNLTVGELMEHMFEALSWEFPTTFLNELDY
jgi:hypothetical protein